MSDTQTSPESSVEDRLANFFSPEPEAAPEVEDSAPADTSEAPEENQYADAEENAEESAPSADLEEFTTDEGATYQVPKDLKPYLERRADYSKKTAELSVLREQAQDRLHYTEAREQIMGSVIQELGQLQALQSQLAQFQNFDTSQLSLEQKWDLRERQTALERQLSQVSGAIQAKARAAEEKQQLHARTQWDLAQRGFMERIGKVSQEENNAMLRTVQETGFSESELKTRFADPRFLALVHKAAKWDSLQQGKPAAVATASKAPPVVRPGGVTNTASVSKDKALRQRLKTTGNVRDAAALIASRMR